MIVWNVSSIPPLLQGFKRNTFFIINNGTLFYPYEAEYKDVLGL